MKSLTQTIITTAFLILLTPRLCHAAITPFSLPFSENFDGAANNAKLVNRTNGYWGGNSNTKYSTFQGTNIDSSGLNTAAGAFNALLWVTGSTGSSDYSQFAVAQSGSVYASFYFDELTDPPATDTAILGFDTGTASLGSGIKPNVLGLYLKSVGTGQYRIGVSKSNTTTVAYSPTTLNTATAYRVFIKREYSAATTTDDSYKLWITPYNGAAPQEASPDVIATNGAVTDPGSINSFHVLLLSSTLSWYLDGLMIDSTWAGVGGNSGSTPPPTNTAPVITNLLVDATVLELSGTNGTPNAFFQVLASTNLGSPKGLWPALNTNTFDAGGNFDSTLPASAVPTLFFQLQVPGGGTPPFITASPHEQAAIAGHNVTFNVGATGTAPLSYQWFFAGNLPLHGETNTSLTLTNVQDTDVGEYSVTAGNNYGLATSSNVVLTVTDPPIIDSQPQSLTVSSGQDATFAANASGSPVLYYQWYFNTNTPLTGATDATLTVTNAQGTNAGRYSIVITNSVGSVASSFAMLTVLTGPTAPSITTTPQSQTVTLSNNAMFTVVAGGTPPLYYQWYYNTNTLLASATNTILTITNVQSTNAGGYSVIVTNTTGSVTSSIATLTISSSVVAPSITIQPVKAAAIVGQNTNFTVVASGTPPLKYQWFFNVNTPLAGATNATLSLTNVQPDSPGGYSVIVTNNGGTVTSSVVQLTLTASAGTPPLPTIPGGVYLVTSYGAKGDGATVNTTSIQNAINAASTAGGGTVEIPAAAGTYLSGPLTMKSKINLQVDAGATLQMLPKASWPGTITFINGSSLTDVEISGSGTIDGQGAGWWPAGGSRPNFINFGGCNRLSILDVRLQNPPTFHLMLKGNNANITIQGIDINTPYPSPNTDGMDLGSTNILIKNCHISDGDDNIEIGGSSALVAWVTITNCVFGYGHGVSVGGYTQAGIHDVTVINCIFTNTEYGIKIKSDNDRGGVVQNMYYYNLSMTNLKYAPLAFYSYYNTYGGILTTKGITPSVAASTAVASVTSTEPTYRNIIVSNLTATAAQPGMIFARTEFLATNIILAKLNITSTDSGAGNGSFGIYNARGVQVSDSQIHVAGSRKQFELFNAQVTFSNSAPGGAAISLDGVSVTNALAFYNQSASLSDGTFFSANPISLGGSTLSDGTSLTLAGTTPINFSLGTNATQIAVTGNLSLNSTLNIAQGPGFGSGTNLLFTYTGSFSGTPILGTTPGIYTYTLKTNTVGQISLIIGP